MTALYRRYRPETFTEVIGQEHVTAPLMQAIKADRITHAYLFSGPRGCGKTTSARILARCLNCAEGPTPTPCGRCESCVELARGGAGSLDVVEIDAASHNGVDDARDLRERAAFAPARDRFKIFILDEAHMVTPQGFNALLKIVEEPPAHVKFVFATTEPDKVIGTIRSRTHHYPFRLVPPDVLQPYLEELCAAEGVPVGSGVLPLVVRAGGGSVRDSLSVLDQLVAGADAGGLDYERAVALLGFTHAALLDDTVEAIAARDGASAFRVVERVVSTGHEPRRFVEDLLERLRDLIVVAASGESASSVLRDLPADQLERMRAQAATLGPAELSRSADLVNDALTEMTGATSPRLHLELLVARLLLPALEDGARGLGARVERLERDLAGGVRVPIAGADAPARPVPAADVAPRSAPPAPAPAPAPTPAPPAPPAHSADVPSSSAAPDPAADDDRPEQPGPEAGELAAANGAAAAPDRPTAEPSRQAEAPGRPTSEPSHQAEAPRRPAEPGHPAEESGHAATAPAPGAPSGAVPAPEREAAAGTPAPVPERPAPAPDRTPTAAAPPAHAPADQPAVDAETVRRRWPEVLQTLRGLRMATWVLVSQNAHVGEVTHERLALAFSTPQLATTFRSGNHVDNVRRALHETLGLDVRVDPVLAGEAGAAAGGQGGSTSDSGAAATGGPAPGSPAAGGATSGGPATTGRGPGSPPAPGMMSAEQAAASWDVAPARTAAREPGQRPAPSSSAPASPAATADPEPEPPSPAEPAATSYPSTSAGPDASAHPSVPDRAAAAPQRDRAPEPPPWDTGEDIPLGPEPELEPAPEPARSGWRAARDAVPAAAAPRYDDGEDTSPDDPDMAASGLVGAPLVAQMLGGTVIDEIPEDS